MQSVPSICYPHNSCPATCLQWYLVHRRNHSSCSVSFPNRHGGLTWPERTESYRESIFREESDPFGRVCARVHRLLILKVRLYQNWWRFNGAMIIFFFSPTESLQSANTRARRLVHKMHWCFPGLEMVFEWRGFETLKKLGAQSFFLLMILWRLPPFVLSSVAPVWAGGPCFVRRNAYFRSRSGSSLGYLRMVCYFSFESCWLPRIVYSHEALVLRN